MTEGRRETFEDFFGGPSADFQQARRDALARGGIERFPEFSGELPSRALLQEADGAKLPDTHEERFAYVVYRSGDIDHTDSFTLATRGFLFDDITGAYIPLPIAKRLVEVLNIYEEEVEGAASVSASLEDYLKEMEDDFTVENLPHEVKSIGRPAQLRSYRFIRDLSPDKKMILWGAYVAKFISLVEDANGPFPDH